MRKISIPNKFNHKPQALARVSEENKEKTTARLKYFVVKASILEGCRKTDILLACHFIVCLDSSLIKNGSYCISRNIDSDFNLAIWQKHRDRQINLRHYRSIYTTSMGFSPYSTEIRQFKIPPTAV